MGVSFPFTVSERAKLSLGGRVYLVEEVYLVCLVIHLSGHMTSDIR
jgi:hypothetical protein